MTRTWIDTAAQVLDGLEGIGLLRDAPLAARTYIGVGGHAPILLAPENAECLARALARLHGAGVPFEFLGAGSNLLVADAGPSFVVVSSERLDFEPRIEGDLVVAGAGYSLPRLVTRLQKAGLGGLEFAEGIPGSVGGAARMNAGWHEGEFGTRVASLLVIARDGSDATLTAGPGTFAYRRSPEIGDRFVAEATLRLVPGDPAVIARTMREYHDHRVRTQPTGQRNAGCMFKNPPGDHAGRLIEACGLKGFTIGRAQVSPLHANFFINLGNATCDDVVLLLDHTRERVRRETGVTLETEVIVWK